MQQFLFTMTEHPGTTTSLDPVKQKRVSQILLKVTTFITGDSQHQWYVQTLFAKVVSEHYKCMVLLARLTVYADK